MSRTEDGKLGVSEEHNSWHFQIRIFFGYFHFFSPEGLSQLRVELLLHLKIALLETSHTSSADQYWIQCPWLQHLGFSMGHCLLYGSCTSKHLQCLIQSVAVLSTPSPCRNLRPSQLLPYLPSTHSIITMSRISQLYPLSSCPLIISTLDPKPYKSSLSFQNYPLGPILQKLSIKYLCKI